LSGYYRGIHSVPFKGLSSEFSQYRQYLPGDDFSRIDWKVFLRSGKAYIKESDDESNTSLFIIVDSSKSMIFGNKSDYAASLAAVLGFVSINQNDSLGYTILSGGNGEVKPPSSKKSRLFEFFADLGSLKPSGAINMDTLYGKIVNSIKKRSFFVLISDGFLEEERLFKLFDNVRAKKTDAIFFHLHSQSDTDEDILSSVSLKDIESGETIQGGSFESRKRTLIQRNRRIYAQCALSGIEHIDVYVEEGFSKPLSYFFEKRRK